MSLINIIAATGTIFYMLDHETKVSIMSVILELGGYYTTTIFDTEYKLYYLMINVISELPGALKSNFRKNNNILPRYGYYQVVHNCQLIHVIYLNVIILICHDSTIIDKYLNSIQVEEIASDNKIFYYFHKADEWKECISRPHEDYDTSRINKKMKEVMDLITLNYRSNKHRQNYLIHGKPGTGKTTIAKMIAQKHKMDIYPVVISSKDLDDRSFLALMRKVKENSVIVIDEFDKYFLSDKQRITHGAFLEALDGLPDLANGVVVIIICNSLSNIPTNFREPLTRTGRINHIAELTEEI